MRAEYMDAPITDIEGALVAHNPTMLQKLRLALMSARVVFRVVDDVTEIELNREARLALALGLVCLEREAEAANQAAH